MIPDFQTLMLPFLKALSDGTEHKLRDIINSLSEQYNLSEEERSILLPSGNQAIIDNRIGWARTYLKKAGLLEAPQRATFKITENGKKVLLSNPGRIDVAYLKKLPSFVEWVNSYTNAITEEEIKEIAAISKDVGMITPTELIDMGFTQMNESLSFEISQKIKDISDKQFERLVLKVLTGMGYGGFRENAAEHTGKSNDGGIDGLIREDKLGLDTIYVQAKKYTDTVGINHIRDFAGSLLSKRAKKGVFITSSTFPQSAHEFVSSIDPKIALIDGNDLARFMVENNVGVTRKRVIEIKDVNDSFFDEL